MYHRMLLIKLPVIRLRHIRVVCKGFPTYRNEVRPSPFVGLTDVWIELVQLEGNALKSNVPYRLFKVN